MVFKLCLLAIMLACCQAANILYVIPFSGYSHYIMLRPIGLELARRGHNVTVLTAFPEKDPPPNYHEVRAQDKKIWETGKTPGVRPNIFTMIDMPDEKFHQEVIWLGGLGSTEVTLSSPEIMEFLKKDNQFDIVISQQFYQEAFFMLAHKYKAPLAVITTFGNCMRHNFMIRNPMQFSTLLSEFIRIKDPSSFFGRFKNFYFTVYEYIMWRYYYLERQNELVDKYIPDIPEPRPSLEELERNSALTLINSHFSFDGGAAFLPNVVEIGGVHLFGDTKNNSVPQDIQDILAKAKDGIVYINFGTNVRSSELPVEKKNAFLNVFKKLKQTVLWKWEDDSLVDIPKNLVVRKWMPQKEILSSPNTQVFISHGGLIGTQEAIMHGVPIIGVPVFADQYNNLLQAQEIGFGKILNFHDITEENLEKMLHEVLKDNTYKNKAKVMSQRFKDRPMSPLDTAVYWIEYVIRHKGDDFMKSAALNQSWIAYYMVDVYVFILVLVLVPIFILFVLIKILLGFVNAKKSKNVKKKVQ